jgi:hypothetical protein
VVGCVICLWLHLAIAATFIPSIGRQVVFMTAWPFLSTFPQCQRQIKMTLPEVYPLTKFPKSDQGYFFWRIHYWPERFGYAWTPYGQFLLLGSIGSDMVIVPNILVHLPTVSAPDQDDFTRGLSTHQIPQEWPERFGYAWTPYGQFLLLGSIGSDMVYAVVYIYHHHHPMRRMPCTHINEPSAPWC